MSKKNATRLPAGLTPKQERFVAEYLIDLNATQAAIRAGYSSKTAKVIGSENLSKPAIQAAISDEQRAVFEARRQRRTFSRTAGSAMRTRPSATGQTGGFCISQRCRSTCGWRLFA
jgi:phage terminase small subunit